MERKLDVLINFVGTPYSFHDADTGRKIEGCSVWYQFANSQNDKSGVGFLPVKKAMPANYYDAVKNKQFPIKAKAVVVDKPTAKGIVSEIERFEV